MRVLLSLVVVLLGVAVRAEAQTPTPLGASLAWERTGAAVASCAPQEELMQRIEARLGRALFSGRVQPSLVIRGHSEGNGQGQWNAHIDLLSTAGQNLGERNLQVRAPDCSALNDAVVLTLSLMLDRAEREPNAITAKNQPESLPEQKPVDTPTTPKPQAPAAPEIKPHPITPEPLAVKNQRFYFKPEPALMAASVLGGGGLPGLGLGAKGAVSVALPLLGRAELDAIAWLPQMETVGAAGAHFNRFDFGLWLCPIAQLGRRWVYLACLGGRMGHMATRGYGFATNGKISEWVYGVGAQGRFGLRLNRFLFTTVGFELGIPLSKASYFYTRTDDRSEEIYRVPNMTVALDLGIGFIFGS